MNPRSFYKPVERGFEREMKKRLEYYSSLRNKINEKKVKKKFNGLCMWSTLLSGITVGTNNIGISREPWEVARIKFF